MSAGTCSSPQQSLVGRLRWRPAVVIVAALLAVISMFGIFNPAPASAAAFSVQQCNGHIPGSPSLGATTILNCDITVVNTINGGVRGSVVTIARDCLADPCTGDVSQSFTDVVTNITQCNGSNNDASNTINCTVHVINNISADTPNAQPVSAATSNQCNGTPGLNTCNPSSSTTTNATITQCNGSGASGILNCSVDPTSNISPAIPIQINQCVGSGNAGANTVHCTSEIHTNITAAAVTATTAPPTPAATTTAPGSSGTTGPGTTGTTTPGSSNTAPGVLGTAVTPGGTGTGTTPTGSSDTTGVPTTVGATPQVAIVPTGGVQTGGGSTAGLQHVLLLTISLGLLLAAGFSGLLSRRFTRGS